MSKDIWYKADEIPLVKRYRIIETRDNRYYLNNTDSRPLSLINRWCYLDDLLALETELERTRKALDVAVDALKKISLRYSEERNAPEGVWTIAAIDMAEYADNALEQKDVK